MALTPYEEQPLHRIIRQRRLTYPAVAHAIGLVDVNDERECASVRSLRNVGKGRVYPSAVMKEKLPAFLGVPLEDLFTEKILAGSEHHVGLARRTGSVR